MVPWRPIAANEPHQRRARRAVRSTDDCAFSQNISSWPTVATSGLAFLTSSGELKTRRVSRDTNAAAEALGGSPREPTARC